ncbi:MAG: alpha/beta hydrolase-fold protein [Pseudomonadota bacterium]
MTAILDAETVTTAEPCTHSVIWLHGLGADGHDFVPVVPELGLPSDLAVRFVFPHSEERAVTINGGMRMRAWYDIKSLDRHGRADEAGIRESQAQIEQLIRRENERGVPTANIVIAGFSQGGAVALQVGLRYAETFAGIMVLSSYLALEDSLADERSEANARTPLFMAHGLHDPMVTLDMGTQSREALNAQGIAVDWHEYPMAHQVCLEELRDIGAWLRRVLAPQ